MCSQTLKSILVNILVLQDIYIEMVLSIKIPVKRLGVFYMIMIKKLFKRLT